VRQDVRPRIVGKTYNNTIPEKQRMRGPCDGTHGPPAMQLKNCYKILVKI